jgi:hypothetical protein
MSAAEPLVGRRIADATSYAKQGASPATPNQPSSRPGKKSAVPSVSRSVWVAANVDPSVIVRQHVTVVTVPIVPAPPSCQVTPGIGKADKIGVSSNATGHLVPPRDGPLGRKLGRIFIPPPLPCPACLAPLSRATGSPPRPRRERRSVLRTKKAPIGERCEEERPIGEVAG